VIEIGTARRDDLDAIHALLEANQLPLDGLDAHLANAFVARDGGRIVGAAALEIYDEGGLLRSVVVAEPARGAGIARGLVDAVLTLARTRGLPAVYLLTTTAPDYFAKLGFATVTRQDVPSGVQRSVEFTSACPASATVMKATTG
jgi:amino-acid N-acetyltransferase